MAILIYIILVGFGANMFYCKGLMIMDCPLIYIILPVYNGGAFFFQQLYTIKSQIYTNWHLVVINDGSTDDTESKLQKFITCYNLINKVTIISQKNAGQYAACGTGLKEVMKLSRGNYEGTYIVYCDADDLWTDNKLLEQIKFMKDYPDCDLSYHDCWVINEYNEVIGFSSLNYFSCLWKRINSLKFFEICMGPCAISTTMMFKSKRINKILPVYPKFSQDWWVMLILSGCDAKICKIDEKYGFYRRSKKSSLAIKKKTLKPIDWHNNYLGALQFSAKRIKKSNCKILDYIIQYYKLKISMMEQNKPLLYKASNILIKFPKIIPYLIKNAVLLMKDYVHFLCEARKLLKLKNL